MKSAFASGKLVKDRAVFEKMLTKAFTAVGVDLDAKLKAALLAPGSMGERDPSAEVCLDKRGKTEPDPELRGIWRCRGEVEELPEIPDGDEKAEEKVNAVLRRPRRSR